MTTSNTPAQTNTLTPRTGRPRSTPAMRVTVLKRGVKTRTSKQDWTCIYVPGSVLAKLLALAGGSKKLVAAAVRETSRLTNLQPSFNFSTSVLSRTEKVLREMYAAQEAEAVANNSAWAEAQGPGSGGMQ